MKSYVLENISSCAKAAMELRRIAVMMMYAEQTPRMRMRQIGIVTAFVFCVVSFGPVTFCQEQPEKVNLCQLKSDPPAYNHKLLEVTGFVSHDFEDFTLFDPTCPSWQEVWLEYGGKSKSGTMYCCGVTADRQRPDELLIENIPISLTDNERFQEFDKQIQPPFRSGRHGAIAHATIVGRFFAGHQEKSPKGVYWGGYGHMGCCSLVAIQEIRSVSPQDRNGLDYGASPDDPDMDKTGCGYTILTPLQLEAELIKVQKEAEFSQQGWMFDDPQRVAANAIVRYANIGAQSIKTLKQKRKAEGRVVYEWKQSGKREIYMVVVSRPYWLSFYAQDPKRVAWVVVAAYLSCGKN